MALPTLGISLKDAGGVKCEARYKKIYTDGMVIVGDEDVEGKGEKSRRGETAWMERGFGWKRRDVSKIHRTSRGLSKDLSRSVEIGEKFE